MNSLALSVALVLSVLAALSAGFTLQTRPVSRRQQLRSQSLSMMDHSLLSSFPSLLSAVAVETKPDDYVYGAVAAPDWVLPLGSVLVILTAALPFLLRPGENALEEQRKNEATTNNVFNKRKNKDLL